MSAPSSSPYVSKMHLSPPVRAEILRGLAPVAASTAAAGLEAFAGRLAAALLAASESLSDPREANLTFNAGQLLKNNIYPFQYVASAAIESALRTEVQEFQPHGKKQWSDGLLSQDVALSLVSYEEMDRKLAVSRVSRTLELSNAESLAALNMRLSNLMECECLSVAQNPFRPEVFLKALHAAWCDFDPDVATHPLVLPLLRSDILPDLAPVYQAINEHLIKHGILPELQESYRIKKSPSVEDPAKPVPPTKELVAQKLKDIFSGQSGSGVGNAGQPRFESGGSSQTAGTAHPGAGFAGGQHHFGSVSEGTDYSHPAFDSGPNPVDSPLFHHLADMQKNMAIRKMVEGAQEVMRLSQMREQISAFAGNTVEKSTLDLMSKIFDAVFTNHAIPNPVKGLIAALQVPVLKAALLDKDFFFQESHPARRLVDMLSEQSLAWDQSKGTADPLFQAMQRNVNRVQQEFDEKIALFEEVVSDLQQVVAREEEARKEALQQPIKRALQKETIKQANVAATSEVALRVGTGEVVAFVETFLENRWVKVLTLAYTLKDEKPRVVEDAIKTMDDLIWSVKPKITLEQRQELLNRLPAILARLNKWLSVIKWDDADRVQFFADLAECHASIVRAPLDISPERQVEIAVEVAQKAAERRLQKKAQQEASAPPPPPQDEHVQTVANLERGVWMELTWKTGVASRVRLAWISPMRSLYIFTTSKKEQSFSLSAEELEQCFRDQRAQVLMLDKLVDRALMEALEVKEEEAEEEH